MSKSLTILNGYRDALKADAALEAWCQANFNAALTVYKGVDVRQEPGVKEAPFVYLVPGPSTEGLEAINHLYSMIVAWGIVHEDDIVTPGKPVEEIAGIDLADAMGDLILEAIKGASSNVIPSDWVYWLEPIEFYPLILGSANITLTVPNLLGGTITF